MLCGLPHERCNTRTHQHFSPLSPCHSCQVSRGEGYKKTTTSTVDISVIMMRWTCFCGTFKQLSCLARKRPPPCLGKGADGEAGSCWRQRGRCGERWHALPFPAAVDKTRVAVISKWANRCSNLHHRCYRCLSLPRPPHQNRMNNQSCAAVQPVMCSVRYSNDQDSYHLPSAYEIAPLRRQNPGGSGGIVRNRKQHSSPQVSLTF